MEDKNIAVQTDAGTETATAMDSKQTVSNDTQDQAEKSTPKTFTLDEFNNAMASVRTKTEDKVLKQFKDVDVERYRELTAQEDKRKLDEQAKRGEFEKILKDTAEKKDSEIDQLRTQLNSVKVDGAILNAASKYRAVSPEQVAKLVKDNVKLNDAGEVEVWGDNNAPKYNEKGDLLSVDEYIKEFLVSNPHFASAGPAGTGGKSNTQPDGIKDVDISNLDMNNPSHRKVYKDLKAKSTSGPRMF